MLVGGLGEAGEVLWLRHVAGDRQNIVRSAGNFTRYPACGCKRAAFAVGKHDLHAEPGKAFGGRQSDAAGSTCDDGDAPGGEGGEIGFGVGDHASGSMLFA